MKYASELYLKKFGEEKDHWSTDATELETIIKQETKEKSHKIDLNLFYEMIEYASEIPYEDEDEHLNKHWEKSINSYLKKFYPKEKHYYLFPNEQASKQKLKTYTIYGIQGHHYKAEIKANSKEQAIKLAENNHEDYVWEDTDYIDDWNYEAE